MIAWWTLSLSGKVGTSFAALVQKGSEWPVVRDQSSKGGFYAPRELFKAGKGGRVRHEFTAYAPDPADICPSAG
jgi:hypothetical protein